MKDKVLITGANGFIGSHLTAACLKQDMEVHAAVRKNSDLTIFRTLVAPDSNMRTVFPDYTSTEKLASFLKEENYRYIVHSAGITKAGKEAIYRGVNAELTQNLAQAAVLSGIGLRRFIQISSLAALGPIRYSGEGKRPAPVTAYGRSKLLAESYLGAINDLPLTILRPTAVYGPGEKDLFILFRLLAKGWDLTIGKSPQKLTFVYVEDLVSAIILAMQHQAPGRLSFDISDGREYSRYALTEAFTASVNKKCRRIHVPIDLVKTLAQLNELYASVSRRYPALNKEKLRELTAENWYCDIQPAREILGYNPRYSLDDGVPETLRWYKDHRWL